MLSLSQKEMIFTKWNFLDEVCIFLDSLMPEHQGIEKGAKIAKKNIFDFLSFWSGLNVTMLQCYNVTMLQCSVLFLLKH